MAWWCKGRALDSRSNGHEFDSQLGRYQATTPGKLFTPMCLCYQAVKLVPAKAGK